MNCGWKQAAILAVYSILEGWLGRTEKVKSGSVFEIVIRVLMAAFNKIFKKEK